MLRLQPQCFCMIFFMFYTSLSAQYRCNFEEGMDQSAVSYPIGSFSCSTDNVIDGKQSLAHVLDNQNSGEACFSASLPTFNFNDFDVSWQFRLRHGYTPSQSNNWLFFLTSDKAADQMSQASGFAIGVNVTTTDDMLQLYSVVNGKYTAILTTTFNWETSVGITSAPLIQVKRKADGMWIISISIDGRSSNLQQIAKGESASSFNASYWGLRYKFTKTQDLKLWLDDVAIDYLLSDSPHYQVNTAKEYDVVISELMPDPEPVVGLPAFEYVELQNRSKHNIDVTNWTLAVGSKTFRLPALTLNADSVVIISTTDGANALKIFGKAFGLFSSKTTLSNEGTSLVLRDKNRKTIDATSYTASNLNGSEGGRSIISKRVVFPCLTDDYWQITSDEKGGTPGRAEPIIAKPFQTLRILKSYIDDDNAVHIAMNQSVDSFAATQPLHYLLSESEFEINSISVIPPYFNEISLSLNKPLVAGNVLTISLLPSYCLCDSSLTSDTLKTRVALPEKAGKDDVILSEIRFEPLTGYPEFIEIQNVSNKVIDAGSLALRVTSASGNATEAKFSSSQLLFPKEFRAYFDEVDSMQCPLNEQSQVWKGKPNFTSEEGQLELLDTTGKVFETVHYNQDWQFVLLNEKRGHSLERVSAQLPANEANSWQTSAYPCGTPGIANSQQILGNQDNPRLTLSAETIGLTLALLPKVDICLTNLPLGGMVTVQLFDALGRHVCWVSRNQLAGNMYCSSWYGKNENQQIVDNGIYIIFVRWIHPKGKVMEWKKTVVWVNA